MHEKHDCCHIDQLNTANSLEEIYSVCATFLAEFGFEKFIYGARMPTSFTHPDVYIVNGYPEEWRTRYIELNYIAIDPTVSYCTQNILPLDWADLQLLEQENSEIGEFMNEARAFGLKQGISFPLHGAQGEFAMLSLACADSRELFLQKIQIILPFMQLFFPYLHEAVRHIIEVKDSSSEKQDLTKRERECLLWVAEGKSSWEIAKIINVSESSVVHYLRDAMKKMGATNRQQTIARAVVKGLIAPKLGCF